MEFKFTAEEEQFRSEVVSWLDDNLDGEFLDGRAYRGENWARVVDFNKRLAKAGWLTAAWPKEYYGMGASHIQQFILNEELSYSGAPVGVNINRVGYSGPTIYTYGTDEQKARHLPGIASGEVMWVQGFSEPGAGSDLASLKTRADRDGDYYIVNGQKIWTSFAPLGDWMILLARTDQDAPKHRGISFFLLDMKTPGVEVRPLKNMIGGEAEFAEVFFDNVRVPVTDRIGEENRGWYIATTTLDFERSSVANSAACRRMVHRLTDVFRERANGSTSAAHRHAMADLHIEATVGRWLCFRVVSMQSRGLVPNMEASMAKVFNSELLQRIGRTGARTLGMPGQLGAGQYAADDGFWQRHYMSSTARSIGGGTSEIQRNIIATRGLGLPR